MEINLVGMPLPSAELLHRYFLLFAKEGWFSYLPKPLPGLESTTAVYCSVLSLFHVTVAWSVREKPRLLVDREPVEISLIEF